MYFASLTRQLAEKNSCLSCPHVDFTRRPPGRGKTTLVKELLAEWGYDPAQVQSPTFLKLLEHEVPCLGLCVHMDAYRMEDDAEDWEKLSLESYTDAKLWLVEWPEKLERYLEVQTALKKIFRIRGFSSAHPNFFGSPRYA